MKFIPIKTLSNIMPINMRFRALFVAVGEIIARLDALEAGTTAVTVQTDELPVEDAHGAAELQEIEDIELTDEQIREKAQEAGIKSWHVKSIDTLNTELAKLEG